ncbi:hypothetical protein JIN85_01740 [Luteolibacter pohnpeiensis]|uniref:Uncharacterized protein n=1 Tax=Luteolibacter pohnpeiensis TaxID=454153 RepID=A0A934S4R5_9BACT|nr:hypothetical protein [Luteolibacter pohnpeiensis]MBK1881114.1 hypothetical protein [Luteolibacter pohnpeiensis]
MTQIIPAILGIVLSITILGFIPYMIWVILTAFKKRWKKVSLQIAIYVTTLTLPIAGLFLFKTKDHQTYLAGLFDTEVELAVPVYDYDSERSFNGDGLSFAVYELPATIRTRFENADLRLLSEFPKRPNYRNRWEFEHWRQTPSAPEFKEYLKFARAPHEIDNVEQLKEHFEAMETALKQKGSYYAFFLQYLVWPCE